MIRRGLKFAKEINCRLYNITLQSTDEKQKEVIDFVEFIKVNELREIENHMDAVITENDEAL